MFNKWITKNFIDNKNGRQEKLQHLPPNQGETEQNEQ